MADIQGGLSLEKVEPSLVLQGLVYGIPGLALADRDYREITREVTEEKRCFSVLTGESRLMWLGFLPVRRRRAVAALVTLGGDGRMIYVYRYASSDSSGLTELIVGLQRAGYSVEVEDCGWPELFPSESLSFWSIVFPFFV